MHWYPPLRPIQNVCCTAKSNPRKCDCFGHRIEPCPRSFMGAQDAISSHYQPTLLWSSFLPKSCLDWAQICFELIIAHGKHTRKADCVVVNL